MDHPDWKSLITECFQSTEFMAISTYGDKGLWVNPVYFAWGDSFNIYFISQLDCTHMDNILSNSEVACAVFPTDRPIGEDVFGVYLKGNASVLEDAQEIKDADQVYYQRVYPNDESQKNIDTYRSDPTWHFVKIKLTNVSYFDTRYFDEKRVNVPKEVWS